MLVNFPPYYPSLGGDDDTNDDEWQSRLPPGVHDIVKCRVNGGECRKCGKVGTWDFIKSAPCPPRGPANAAIPNSEPSPPPVSGHGENLGKMLDEAIKNGDEEAAFQIVAKMETQQAEESLQDQQLILELMEQELELMDAMEQLEKLESLQRLEEEEAELEQAILLSKQPLEKVDPNFVSRPPATPCNSSTTPPVVHKPVVAQPPSVCFLALKTLPWDCSQQNKVKELYSAEWYPCSGFKLCVSFLYLSNSKKMHSSIR